MAPLARALRRAAGAYVVYVCAGLATLGRAARIKADGQRVWENLQPEEAVVGAANATAAWKAFKVTPGVPIMAQEMKSNACWAYARATALYYLGYNPSKRIPFRPKMKADFDYRMARTNRIPTPKGDFIAASASLPEVRFIKDASTMLDLASYRSASALLCEMTNAIMQGSIVVLTMADSDCEVLHYVTLFGVVIPRKSPLTLDSLTKDERGRCGVRYPRDSDRVKFLIMDPYTDLKPGEEQKCKSTSTMALEPRPEDKNPTCTKDLKSHESVYITGIEEIKRGECGNDRYIVSFAEDLGYNGDFYASVLAMRIISKNKL